MTICSYFFNMDVVTYDPYRNCSRNTLSALLSGNVFFSCMLLFVYDLCTKQAAKSWHT
jgi:hypothetical protein